MSSRTILFVLWVALLAACSSTPDATELPEEEPVVDSAPSVVAPEVLPDAEHPVGELDLDGVKGGRIVFAVSGDVAAVCDALLDFEHADGHRAWAVRHEVLERDETRVVARWAFEGKMGINPTCELEFTRVEAPPGQAKIRYRLRKPAFGLAAFFGDYHVVPDPGDPARSLVAERVFIDSGLWIANASREDVADGLREDARRFSSWMAERTAGPQEMMMDPSPSR